MYGGCMKYGKPWGYCGGGAACDASPFEGGAWPSLVSTACEAAAASLVFCCLTFDLPLPLPFFFGTLAVEAVVVSPSLLLSVLRLLREALEDSVPARPAVEGAPVI